MSDAIFNFRVDDDGKFTYEPYTIPGGPTVPNWPYSSWNESIQFRCEKGPFTLRQRLTEGNFPDLQDPFGGPVEATQQGGLWVAKPKFNSGMSEEDRRATWKEFGSIANYRYVIGVLNTDGTIAVDDNQSGIHTC